MSPTPYPPLQAADVHSAKTDLPATGDFAHTPCDTSGRPVGGSPIAVRDLGCRHWRSTL